jgi:hypothetical protein
MIGSGFEGFASMWRCARRAGVVLAALLAVWEAGVARAAVAEPAPAERVLSWIKSYRDKPEPDLLPEAVRVLAASGAFQEPDAAGVFVGFMAGVVGSNPGKAERLVGAMLRIDPEDNWAVVRAVAYSGLPDWRRLLERIEPRAPNRHTMIEAYVSGRLPTLEEFGVMEQPTAWARMRSRLPWSADLPRPGLEPSPVVMDTFWGYYYATGALLPLSRIVALLPWSSDFDDAGRLTLGSTAKYSLAVNSSRDAELLAALKAARGYQPAGVVSHLDEVIFAAETAEMGKLKSEANAALNELRQKGPAYKRKISWWGRMGEGAISLGCITAAVAGQVQLGVPCVVGGATYSATLRYLSGD